MNRSSSSSRNRISIDDESDINNNDNNAAVLAEMQKKLRSDHGMGDFGDSIMRNVVVRSYNNRRPEQQQNDGQLVLSFIVTQDLCNGFNTLHGGASATAVDIFTSVLLHLKSNEPSVTSDLHVSCIAPAPLGSTVICICQINKAGKGLQFASCDIYKEEVEEEFEFIEEEIRTIMTQQRNDKYTNNNDRIKRRNKRILVTKGLHTKYVLKNNKQRKKGFDGSGSGSGSDGSGGNKPLLQQQQQQQQRRSKL
jgi:uncharacterized protein (TIGR00369 family)